MKLVGVCCLFLKTLKPRDKDQCTREIIRIHISVYWAPVRPHGHTCSVCLTFLWLRSSWKLLREKNPWCLVKPVISSLFLGSHFIPGVCSVINDTFPWWKGSFEKATNLSNLLSPHFYCRPLSFDQSDILLLLASGLYAPRTLEKKYSQIIRF